MGLGILFRVSTGWR